MDIVFFDFDGTLTFKDSLGGFVRYAVGTSAFLLGLLVLSPVLAAYRLGLISNNISKEILISFFFKGWHIRCFQRLADCYSLERIDRIVRPEAMEKLAWHRAQGHTVVVVSASMDNWLRLWCRRQGVELIATGLDVRQGRLTGRFSTGNCHGEEKVRRIREQYDLNAYDVIYAYGDSSGDTAMLAMADRPFYQCFN